MNINEIIGAYDSTDREILNAVRKLFMERVNILLGEDDKPVPLIDFIGNMGDLSIIPNIAYFSEKRVKGKCIKKDVCSLLMYLNISEADDIEYICYSYTKAIRKAFDEENTLYGNVENAYLKEISLRCIGQIYPENAFSIKIEIIIKTKGNL